MTEGLDRGPTRPSLGEMISQDVSMSRRLGLVILGAFLAVFIGLGGFSEVSQALPPGVDVIRNIMVVIMILGVVICAAGIGLMMGRMRDLSSVIADGVEVQGRVLSCKAVADPMRGRYSIDTMLEVRYDYMGKTIQGKTSVPYAAHLNVGQEVALIVDPQEPGRFVLRDAYETEDGLKD